MPTEKKYEVRPPDGGLAILLPGLGAVSTTFIAGVEAIRKGLAKPIGSLTQMGTIRLGKRTEKRSPMIKDFVPLAELSDLSFAAWDIFEDDAYQSARNAGVLEVPLLDELRSNLEAVRPMKAVFDQNYVKRLHGTYVKSGKSKMDLAEQLMEDIREVKRTTGASRAVMVWCGSTETYLEKSAVHQDLDSFEKGLKESSADIAPSMIYAYAALKSGVPYANGAPNLTVDVPALTHLAYERRVPIGGKDFKTGQTLVKTISRPGSKPACWVYGGSPRTSRKTAAGPRQSRPLRPRKSQASVLEHPPARAYPTLQQLLPQGPHPLPAGETTKGWDNIDIFGWLSYPMQIRVDPLCRFNSGSAWFWTSLCFDLSQRAGLKGIQEWLSFYFKSPMTPEGLYPEHDVFIQLTKLKNTLRYLMGEEQITHLGDYVLEHDPTRRAELVSE
jgi:myo-inositol-1-phosphate synthase